MDGIRLIMADGTTLENGQAGLSGGFLFLWFSGMTIEEGFAIATDPNKTNHIVFQFGGMENEYDGYTDCRGISIDDDGLITANMKKGE